MAFFKHRSQPIRVTIGYYAAYIILGLLTSLMGPAIPDLAENTHSSLAELSRFLMAGSFGYLLGGFLGGRLYDRFKGHTIFSGALFFSAVFVAFVPLMPLLGWLGAVLFILGFAEGTLDTGGNSLLTWLHGEKVGPYMNGLHFFFGVGAFLAPMVIAQMVAVTGKVFISFWIFAFAALPLMVRSIYRRVFEIHRLAGSKCPQRNPKVTGFSSGHRIMATHGKELALQASQQTNRSP